MNFPSKMQKKELNTQTKSYIDNKIVSGENGFSKNISGYDLNSIKDSGFYYGNELINAPTNYGYLLVISHPSIKRYTIQIFFNAYSIEKMFVRNQYDGIWNNWKSCNLS